MRKSILATLALSMIHAVFSFGADQWETVLTQRAALDLERDGQFLWLATEGGVLRWDTQEEKYEVFLPIDGLASVNVVSVAVDRRGNKWFAHGDPDVGVSVLDAAGNWSQATSFEGLGLDPGKRANVAFALGDSVWIGTESGATLFFKGERSRLLTEDVTGIASDLILSVASAAGNVWLGTERGLSRFSLTGVRNYTTDDGLPANRIISLAIDPDLKIWVGTINGIVWIENEEVVPAEGFEFLEGLRVRSIDFEAAGEEVIPWFATDNGPYRDDVRVATQVGTGSPPMGAPHLTNAVLVDEQGEIWSANGDRWLFEYDADRQAWVNHSLPGLVTNFISDIIVDQQGFIWTTNAGNVTQAPEGKQRGLHLFDGNVWRNIASPPLAPGLGTIVGVALDSSGNRWFASRRTGSDTPGNLIKLPASVNGYPEEDDFVYFDIAEGAGFSHQAAYNVEVDPSGNKWVAITKIGMAALDALEDVGSWGSWTYPDCLRGEEGNSIPGPSVIDMTFTGDSVWVALELNRATIIDYGGSGSLDNDLDDTCFHWDAANSPLPNNLRTIRADSRGRVWFGTQGGLAMFDPSGSTWKVYTKESTGGGLLHNQVRAIAFDRLGNTWVGTFGGGLAALLPDGETWLEPYTVESNRRRGSGLTKNEIMEIRIHVNENDEEELWIATWGGGVNKLIVDFEEQRPVDPSGKRPPVLAYPNPYVEGERPGSRNRISFRSPPEGSLIEIYTLTGDLVRVLEGPDPDADTDRRGDYAWNLTNEQEVPVAAGVYIFLVRLDGAVYHQGKIAYLR